MSQKPEIPAQKELSLNSLMQPVFFWVSTICRSKLCSLLGDDVAPKHQHEAYKPSRVSFSEPLWDVCSLSAAATGHGMGRPTFRWWRVQNKQVTGDICPPPPKPSSITSSDRAGALQTKESDLGWVCFLDLYSSGSPWMFLVGATGILIQRFSTLAAHHNCMEDLKKYCWLGPISRDSDFTSLGWGFLHGKVIIFTSVTLSPGCTLKSAGDPLNILMPESHPRATKNKSLC